MDQYQTLLISVIESRHEGLTRLFKDKDTSHLTSKQVLLEYTTSCYYFRRAHDLAEADDKGYLEYYDEPLGRYIFVSSKEVGLSKCFHDDMNIISLFHLIEKSTNHEDYSDMTSSTRQWWLDNMRYVALQLMNTEGNIVIFCNKGRTRSPMYLVAYLVIMHCMTVSRAMSVVGTLLHDQRKLVLDRHRSLVPIIERIFVNDDALF